MDLFKFEDKYGKENRSQYLDLIRINAGNHKRTYLELRTGSVITSMYEAFLQAFFLITERRLVINLVMSSSVVVSVLNWYISELRRIYTLSRDTAL